MAKHFPLLILIFSMFGFPAALHAQMLIRLSQVSSTGSADRPLATGRDVPADAGTSRPADANPESGASGDHFHADAGAAPVDPPDRTALDHRFAPEGLVGSVGYGRLLDTRPIDAEEQGPAAVSGLGGPGGFVGAWLSYDF